MLLWPPAVSFDQSKGRNNYYLYYRCTEHTNYNLAGNKLHDAIEGVLKALSFSVHQVKFIKETAKALLIEPQKLKKEQHQNKIRTLHDLNEKIFKLEERLMNNEIESSTYQTWFQKFKEEKAMLEYSLNRDQPSKIRNEDDLIERVLPNLSNLYEIYKKGGLFFAHPEPGKFLQDHEELIIGVTAQAAIALDNSKLFEEVKKLSRRKDEFIALASHELKTPLTSMSGFLQVLQKNASEGNHRKFADKAVKQLNKMNLLVNDLFDISKVQSGKLQFNFEPLDAGELIREICETFEQTVPGHHYSLNLQGDLIINGDKMRLEQVITNLIGNAVKYAPQSPQIDIAAESSQKEIIISVTDQGEGIPSAEQAHIFTQFYRLREQDRHISGLGLGLYITKEIIERHGGRIWVESQPGKGAAFKFSIPRQGHVSSHN